MKYIKVFTILVILFFVSITNASTDKTKIENSFMKDSIEENNPIQSGRYYFVFGRVDNVDRDPGGGYDHCWEFHIIKALVISEEIQGIKIYILVIYII